MGGIVRSLIHVDAFFFFFFFLCRLLVRLRLASKEVGGSPTRCPSTAAMARCWRPTRGPRDAARGVERPRHRRRHGGGDARRQSVQRRRGCPTRCMTSRTSGSTRPRRCRRSLSSPAPAERPQGAPAWRRGRAETPTRWTRCAASTARTWRASAASPRARLLRRGRAALPGRRRVRRVRRAPRRRGRGGAAGVLVRRRRRVLHARDRARAPPGAAAGRDPGPCPRDAVERGYAWWNWGGTWLTQEGVLRFKRKWGARERRYRYFVKLNDRSLFDESPVLSQRRVPTLLRRAVQQPSLGGGGVIGKIVVFGTGNFAEIARLYFDRDSDARRRRVHRAQRQPARTASSAACPSSRSRTSPISTPR